ncbi:MAG: hypothetical protein ACFHHU_00445 [Porticoccaceae bacterium]
MTINRLRITYILAIVASLIIGIQGIYLYLILDHARAARGTADDAVLVSTNTVDVPNFWWSFAGYLNTATADKLEAALSEHEHFSYLWFQSDGGTLEGAERFITLLNDRKVRVHPVYHSRCYSACVKVLLETTARDSLLLSSAEFLIGIHKAHSGDSLLTNYFPSSDGTQSYNSRMMRDWIVAHSPNVASFLDGCPSSPFDDLEMFVLTSRQYNEIAFEQNSYSCADIWHQHEDWADDVFDRWQAEDLRANSEHGLAEEH